VVIVSGSQQALDLIARLCVHPRDSVALEDPGYPEARRVLAGSATRQLFIPVDDEGIDVRALAQRTRTHGPPRVLYVTPSHQFPTGATLSLSRRLALLDWAARRDVLIIEDDYDSEFGSPGRMIESLQGLDRAHKVIYVGTFSTVLFPPLRVGYVVLPPEMVEPFVQAKWLADRQTPTLEQLALTDFLEEGHFERHLRRMRRLVSARRDALRAALEAHLSDWIELPRPSAGMHLMIRLSAPHPGVSAPDTEKRVVAAAASQGVGIYPVGPCCHVPPKEPAFLLGYAALTEQRIQEGIGILSKQISLLYKGFGRIR
jgi:GntR family transcriptional regulator/MocR family aminotransferase